MEATTGQDREGMPLDQKVGGLQAEPSPSASHGPAQHPSHRQRPCLGALGRAGHGSWGSFISFTLLPPQRKERGWARSAGACSPNEGWTSAGQRPSPPLLVAAEEYAPHTRALGPRVGADTRLGKGGACGAGTPRARAAGQPSPQEALLGGLELRREERGGAGPEASCS